MPAGQLGALGDCVIKVAYYAANITQTDEGYPCRRANWAHLAIV